MPTYTRLSGVPDLGRSPLAELIEDNLIDFFAWAFLEAGAWVDVPVATPGADDPYAPEKLYPVSRDGVADGRIWQSTRPGWVHEAGLEVGGTPTVCTGVYVDGTLYPTAGTTGPYAHTLDFPHGRATFAAAIPTTSVVQAAYAYRRFGLYRADADWFRPAVLGVALDDEQAAAGVSKLLDDRRVVVPFVVVEVVPRRTLAGVELGNGAHRVEQDVLFHIVADSKRDRDALLDAICLQQDKTILVYDPNARLAADDRPLDWRGSPIAGAKSYPELLALPPDGYLRGRARFARVRGEDQAAPLPLFAATARATVAVDVASV